MQTVHNAARARRPLVIFCKLGKDRTGLICALVLAVCGASDAEIVADYAKYDIHLCLPPQVNVLHLF